MTIEEYGDLLFDAGYLVNSPETGNLNGEEYNIYRFSENGFEKLKEKFPGYDAKQWVYGLTIGESFRTKKFLGYRPEAKNSWDWSWYNEHFQDVMEYMVNEIFQINANDSYIELDDIVL